MEDLEVELDVELITVILIGKLEAIIVIGSLMEVGVEI